MKAGLFAASAAALAQLVAAQPHGHRHVHLQGRQVAETTTVYLPEVVVYVNEDGTTLGASTKTIPPSSTTSAVSASATASTIVTTISTSSISSSPSSTSPTSTSETPVSTSTVPSTTASPTPSTTSTPEPSTTSTEASSSAVAETSSAAAASSSSASSSSGSSSSTAFTSGFKGASMSFYATDGSCMSSSDIASTIENLANDGVNALRFYNSDCDQAKNVVPAANAAGMAVIAGIFNVGTVTSTLDDYKSQLDGDFSGIHTISVYNEPLNQGLASVSEVVAAIQEAKSYLSSTNFAGSVITIDTFNQLLLSENSAVIEASDYVAANCHAFFDTSVSPSGAADYVKQQISNLEGVAGGKSVVITESGWPSDDPSGTMGSNIASTSAQSEAMSGLKDLNIFTFSAVSTKWHKSGTVEDYWGENGS